MVAAEQVQDLLDLEELVAIPALQEPARLQISEQAGVAAVAALPQARLVAQAVKAELEVCRLNTFGRNGHEMS